MISVNGQPAPEVAGATLDTVIARLGLDAAARGVAVAVDGEVIPRASWGRYELGGEARVEVLTAMQGG